MLYSKPAGAHPGVKFTAQRVGPLRVVRSILQPGQWVDTLIPACQGYRWIENISVQTRGTTVDASGLLAPRLCGWNSRIDVEEISSERVVRRVAVDEVEQWCIRPIDVARGMTLADVATWREGGHGVLKRGWAMLVLSGSVSVDDDVHGPGTHIVARSKDLSPVTESPGYTVFWPIDL